MTAAARPLVEIVDALRSPFAAEDLGVGAAVPLLAVEVTDTDLGRVAADPVLDTLRTLPLVTVAVSHGPLPRWPGLDAFDVLLSTEGATAEVPGSPDLPGRPLSVEPEAGVDPTLALLHERVAANPQASVAAVQLLRLAGHLDVPDALVAESFCYSTLQSGEEFRRWLDSRGASRRSTEAQGGSAALSVERHRGELRLSFCRPEVRNAYGHEVRDALVEALQLAAMDDRIETVIISGEGPSFCSGGDLREFGTLPDPATAHLVRTTRSAGYWIHRLTDRVRVELHGACIGAGAELPAFAGRVVAAEDTYLELPEVGMGLVPGAGGTVSLPRRIGRHRTAYLCLSGEPLGASTALRWGLVDELV